MNIGQSPPPPLGLAPTQTTLDSMHTATCSYALTLGEFDTSIYSGRLVTSTFFIVTTLAINVITLNVLIAIISETFGRMQSEGACSSRTSKHCTRMCVRLWHV